MVIVRQERTGRSAPAVTILVIALVVFAWLVALQARAILRSLFPGLRAIRRP
jgi:hypothetical protein